MASRLPVAARDASIRPGATLLMQLPEVQFMLPHQFGTDLEGRPSYLGEPLGRWGDKKPRRAAKI
jgi:hypothetical protein